MKWFFGRRADSSVPFTHLSKSKRIILICLVLNRHVVSGWIDWRVRSEGRLSREDVDGRGSSWPDGSDAFLVSVGRPGGGLTVWWLVPTCALLPRHDGTGTNDDCRMFPVWWRYERVINRGGFICHILPCRLTKSVSRWPAKFSYLTHPPN